MDIQTGDMRIYMHYVCSQAVVKALTGQGVGPSVRTVGRDAAVSDVTSVGTPYIFYI